jgi:protein-S-isoprenylcysteine O-methyltransferase Ste14
LVAQIAAGCGSGRWRILDLHRTSLALQDHFAFRDNRSGTLAPWDPTQKLVVRGVYRCVRNPMISGVLSILLGETIIFGSVAPFYWFIIFWLINMVYIPLFQEPDLEERFGNDYREYKKHVPRWIPRTSAWKAA